MLRKYLLALAAGFIGVCLLTALPAKAGTYTFDFSYSGPSVSGSGEFIATGSSGSPYAVINVIGSANAQTITGLSNYAAADNLLWYPASLNQVTGQEVPPTFLSQGGISFTTNSGNVWNIGNSSYPTFGGYGIVEKSSNPIGYVNGPSIRLTSFSVTPAAPTLPPSIAPYINGAVNVRTVTTPGGPNTGISANFTPNFGMSLQEVAALGNYTNFNWVQSITYLPTPNPFVANSCLIPLVCPPLTATPAHPLSDPPPGGYLYQLGYNPFPFYYSNADLVNAYNGPALGSLTFFDTPSDSCLFGGSGIGCFGQTVSMSQSNLMFSTDLVGVKADGTWDNLFVFDWQSNFNGTAGGISRLNSDVPLDAGSGFGTVTVLSESLLVGSTPLPSTWVMMLSVVAGFGIINFYRRRKQLSLCYSI